jgi:hypothetical protein
VQDIPEVDGALNQPREILFETRDALGKPQNDPALLSSISQLLPCILTVSMIATMNKFIGANFGAAEAQQRMAWDLALMNAAMLPRNEVFTFLGCVFFFFKGVY